MWFDIGDVFVVLQRSLCVCDGGVNLQYVVCLLNIVSSA